jgi:hypothetical protein
MPTSTEQIIHSDAYGASRDSATRVTLPSLVSGARSVYENNLGEFETRLFLFHHLQEQNSAIRGAAGWDGDRFVLFETTGGDGIAWVTVWDSQIDAGEFYDLLDTSILKRYRDAKPKSATTEQRVYDVGGRTVQLTAAEVNGRPVVLYVDVPTGAPTTVLDLSKVILQ